MRLLTLGLALASASLQAQEPDLVDLAVHVEGLKCEAAYAGSDNFTGRPVLGYKASKCLAVRQMADALVGVQQALKRVGLGLVVWDAYRPQQAVDAFVAWAADPDDTVRKADYYPEMSKDRLIPDGYIAEKSGHSRGATADIGLYDLVTGDLVYMGTRFDFFGPQSGIDWQQITGEQRAARLLLRRVMMDAGFRPYDAEWWHFTLADEPWPDTWFNVPVE